MIYLMGSKQFKEVNNLKKAKQFKTERIIIVILTLIVVALIVYFAMLAQRNSMLGQELAAMQEYVYEVVLEHEVLEEETQKLIFRKCIELLDVSENADILEAAVKVVTIDNRQEFEEILNRLDDDHSQEQYKMIRLEFINKFQDEEAAINFIEDNLMFPKIREIAFERALKAQKFEKAILLCIDALSLEEKSFGISQWLYKLFFVYETLENYSEMIHTAEKILFLGDIKFFDILKAIFIKQKLWESVQTDLLKKCKEKLYYTNYMKILNNEEKHTLLLEALMENDDQIYEYGGSVLTNKYPDEICALFINQINKTADNASSRSSYSWVCEKIEIFVQAGFQEKGVELVKTLKTKYSRRSAFVNELQKLEKRIMPTISPF